MSNENQNTSAQNKAVIPREKLHQSLQELIGLHRQLYEVIKNENEAITNADVKGTYDAAAAKEALIHWIHQSEMSRQAVLYTLCKEEGLENESPSLRDLIAFYSGRDNEISDKLQTDFNTLIILVERIKKQNEMNGKLVEASLKHIHNMKKNIFGETTHQARTYNQQGHKNTGSTSEHGPRLVSKEV
ncbi:MAG: flagellar protein FlgN [Bdellovibrionales bacterium]|nr:flagellar protein FlgN [Bdellovibrionales bacterium]